MSNQANYAATVRNGLAQLSLANTNRDGTGTLVSLVVAGQLGTRVDRVQFQATGTTTAGMLRLFRTRGNAGTPIATLTSSTTTCTVTTTVPHGRSNGELLYMMDCFPQEYNGRALVITVTSPTQFTYTVPTAPTTTAASTVGYYITTAASPISYLWREIPVTAITPSGTVSAWSSYAASATDFGYLPLQLAYGWLLQVATNNAETFTVSADMGMY